MYKYIDGKLDLIKKNIKAYFQNARLGLLKYDEVNKSQVDEEVDKIFDKVVNLNNNFIRGLVKDLEYSEKDYPVEMLNDRYNPTTKYVFSNELERKRARYKESILSSLYGIAENQGKIKDFKQSAVISALSTTAFIKLQNDVSRNISQQIEECAVDDERFMYLNEGVKQGIEYVQWLTMEDDRVCTECRELDGQIFSIDSVPERCHHGCRCELKYLSQEEIDEISSQG